MKYSQFRNLVLSFVITLCLVSGTADARSKRKHIFKTRSQQTVTIRDSDPLPEKIQQILNNAGLSRTPASIEFVSLSDGKVLYEKNPELLLNPASNAKLVTAAAALKTLGPDYTFRTEFYSDTPLRDGKIHNLWIKGFGDPVFVSEELETVVSALTSAGLKQITGQVAVDDTYFDRSHLTTYLSDRGDKLYTISTGPLCFNFNRSASKAIRNGKFGDQLFLSEGVLDPASYTGTVIMQSLAKNGVVFSRNGGLKRQSVPSNAMLLFCHNSPPVREILKGMGKFSNNFIAEQMLKSVGAVRFGPPGSTEKGRRVLNDYMISLHIPPSSFVLDNGSGLSKLTRLSSAQLVQILVDLYKSPWRQEAISSLSVGGVDGTLRHRFRRSALKGKVFAKTGTLNGVSSLSGYLGNKVAFSFVFNDLKVSLPKLRKAEEKILEEVYRSF